MNVVVAIRRMIDNFPTSRPRKNTTFNGIKVFRWNNINGGRGCFSFEIIQCFSWLKRIWVLFAKKVSVIQAKLVSLPACRLQRLNSFDLGAQQKSHKRSYQRRHCTKRSFLGTDCTKCILRNPQNIEQNFLWWHYRKVSWWVSMCFKGVHPKKVKLETSGVSLLNISKGVLTFGKLTVRQRFDM